MFNFNFFVNQMLRITNSILKGVLFFFFNFSLNIILINANIMTNYLM